MRLKNKVALITGAGSGIGRETAHLFAREGASLILTDINEELGNRTLNELNNIDGNILFYEHDVTQEEEWKVIIADAISKFEKLDILVNSAGISIQGSVEDCTLEEWNYVHKVNLDGTFLGIKHFIKKVKYQGNCSIVNISSIEGIVAESHLAAYNSSKGGVRLLTKSSALHCAEKKYGIRVNSVHPGYLHTPMHDRHSEQKIKEFETRHPIGFLGEAIDVAYGVLYLASEEARFVTGSELIIDGGYTAQ